LDDNLSDIEQEINP